LLWCGRHCLIWVCDDHDEVILDGRQAKGLQLDMPAISKARWPSGQACARTFGNQQSL
jgi:hypothetical protein